MSQRFTWRTLREDEQTGYWKNYDGVITEVGMFDCWWTSTPPATHERSFCVARQKSTQKWFVLEYARTGDQHNPVAGPFDTWQQAVAVAKLMA